MLACGLLGACGAAPEPESARPEAAADESVFDPLTSTIERAESVQDTVNQRTEELRRRIEEDER